MLNIKIRVGREEVERIWRDPGRFSDVMVSKQSSNKIESGLVNLILSDEETEFPNNDEYYTFADTSENIKENEIKEKKHYFRNTIKN